LWGIQANLLTKSLPRTVRRSGGFPSGRLGLIVPPTMLTTVDDVIELGMLSAAMYKQKLGKQFIYEF
jgi:hypothetical protein